MPQRKLAAGKTQRRSSLRFKLQLPVIFHWKDKLENMGAGFTIDVAQNGALISSHMCPPVGSDVRIEILLPVPADKTEQLRLQCAGKVMHVESSGAVGQFGVSGMLDFEKLTHQLNG